jgi:hypothetical protein
MIRIKKRKPENRGDDMPRCKRIFPSNNSGGPAERKHVGVTNRKRQSVNGDAGCSSRSTPRGAIDSTRALVCESRSTVPAANNSGITAASASSHVLKCQIINPSRC